MRAQENVKKATLATASSKPAKARARKKPLKLKDWDEVRAYFAKHLKPVGHGPKGQPFYAHEELKKLDIIYPDENE